MTGGPGQTIHGGLDCFPSASAPPAGLAPPLMGCSSGLAPVPATSAVIVNTGSTAAGWLGAAIPPNAAVMPGAIDGLSSGARRTAPAHGQYRIEASFAALRAQAGPMWDFNVLSYAGSRGFETSDLVLASVHISAVPEVPGAAALPLGLAALGSLAPWRRRRPSPI